MKADYLLLLNEQVHDREALQYIYSVCVEMDMVTSLTMQCSKHNS